MRDRTVMAATDVHDLARVFPGDSTMAQLMRDLDWAATPVGSPLHWPANLRTAVGICLTSRFPMHVWWGRELTLFYNDAYIAFLGPGKHPSVLGHSGRDAWPETWDTIGPMIARVFDEGEASWSEDIRMYFDRDLPREEVYVTFSFSPIFGEEGTVDGMFCACTETTEKIIGNRRLDTLRRLGGEAAVSHSVQEACTAAGDALSENPHDVPFFAIYLADENGKGAQLATASGFAGHPVQPPRVVSLDDPAAEARATPWPLLQAFRTQRMTTVMSPEHTVVLPIRAATAETPVGLLVAGVNPRRPLDGSYRAFYSLVAAHIASSITDARTFEAERQRAAQLADLDRAKTDFFSNVSHEFRTPLTLLLGSLEELVAKNARELSGAQRELASVAHRNALRLLRLVNSLLDFSQIETNRIEARFQPVDLADYTVELASSFRSAVEKAGLRYHILCRRVGEKAYIDVEMWEKIVFNLLSNAVKFTSAGAITVAVRATVEGFELEVRDTGCGVAPADLPRIFDRFYRGERTRARSHEGTGIGLALVKELVQYHGGWVDVSSAPDRGTTFRVSLRKGYAHLPADKIVRTSSGRAPNANSYLAEVSRWDVVSAPASRSPLAKSETVASSNGRRPRVLLADDNADMRDYVSRLLSPEYDVETVSDGNEALQRIGSDPPDVIITDVMMPRRDGFSLLREVRDNPKTQAVPIIVLSARAGEEARIEGREHGADDYLIKPFTARELLSRVAANFKLAQLRRRAEQGWQQLHAEVQRRVEERTRELAQAHERLLETEAMLRRTNEGLTAEVSALRMTNVTARDAHRATLNLLEDAVEARRALQVEMVERERAEKILRASEARQSFLLRLADVLRPLSDPVEIQEAATRVLAEQLAADRVGYAEDLAEDGVFTVTQTCGPGISAVGAKDHRVEIGAKLLQQLKAGRTVVSANTADDASWSNAEKMAFAAIAVGAVASKPLLLGGRVAAALFVHFRQPHDWSEAELALIDDTADRAWAAVQHARAEKALRESQMLLQKAFSAETVGVLFFNLAGGMREANATFVRMSGYTRDELFALHWQVMTAPEFAEATQRAARELACNGETAPYEKQMVRKDGSRWWALVAPTRLTGTGTNSDCVEFVLDITPQKTAQEASRQNEERLRTLFNSMTEAFVVKEAVYDEKGGVVDFRYIEWNPAFRQQTGLPDPRGRTVRELMPDIEPLWFEHFERVLRTGEPAQFEAFIGPLHRWLSVSATRLGGPESRRVAIVFMDVTERKGSQLELVALKDKLAADLAGMRRLYELNQRLLHAATLQESLQEILATATEFLRAPKGNVQLVAPDGKHLEISVQTGHGPEFLEYFAKRGAPGTCEKAMATRTRVVVEDITANAELAGTRDLEILLADGIRAVQSTPLISRNGRLLGMLNNQFATAHAPSESELRQLDLLAWMASDFIERAVAEEALRGADRRKSEFIAVLGHELRNPLAAIAGGIRLMQSPKASEASRAAALPVVAEQVAHMERLIDDVLDVARISQGKVQVRLEREELQPIVERAVRMAQEAVANSGCTLRVNLAPEPIFVHADPVRLAQVVLNLLSNAVKYSLPFGQIDVEVERAHDEAVIRVRDQGIGMSPELLPHVFDMFVQAKRAISTTGGGLGLGLSVVRHLVQMHGGRVIARSEGEDKGSEFTVYLPVTSPPK